MGVGGGAEGGLSSAQESQARPQHRGSERGLLTGSLGGPRVVAGDTSVWRSAGAPGSTGLRIFLL